MNTGYILTVAGIVLISVLLAMSLNLIQGYTGIMSVSHGASMGIGAYTTGVLATTHHWPGLLALAAGVVVAGVMEWLFMAAASALDSDDFILASFALQMAVIDLLLRWTPVTGGSAGLFGIPRPTIFGYTFDGLWSFFLLLVLVVVLCALMLGQVGRSGYGILLRGIRESPRGVEALGKNVFHAQTRTFALANAVAGLAGGLWAMALGIITPVDFNVQRSILIVAFLLVGGVGNMAGALLGAAVMMVLPEIVKQFSTIPTQFQGPGEQIVYGVVIVLFVWFRREGILPERPIIRLRRARRPWNRSTPSGGPAAGATVRSDTKEVRADVPAR